MGLCRDRADCAGQGALQMEACVDHAVLQHEDEALAYPFAIPRLAGSGLPYIEPLAMWTALLGDLILHTPVPTMAARFHKGLAASIVRMVHQLAQAQASPLRQVALSGGVFQNRVLHERVAQGLRAAGYQVLSHQRVPCNDGGLALGQACVAAALALHPLPQETTPCA
jgi:hydrogenase maturation protein HypF